MRIDNITYKKISSKEELKESLNRLFKSVS